ncbi:MAG: sensor histidine kinase, partial [Rhodothermales bacterium]|nr:sensor histidine kinase [Rhodothermales bacterium]
IVPEPQDEILVAPGALSADSYAGRVVVSENLPAGVHLRYPIRVTNHYFGTAEVGPKENDLRFSDEDLLFLERLSLRCADQSARMELYDQALRRELDFAQTRLRIAADLHDDIGSNLSGIALMTESAADSADGRDRLMEISRFARSMVDSLRDIVWSIDPDSDSTEQLIDRMKDAASTILAGTRHSFETRGEFLQAPSPVFQRNVFLIFKEAIHNVARHAKANHVAITVESENGTLTLTVTDDGVGFVSDASSDGLGLKSMTRRAERISGRLSVDSAPGSGTTLRLTARMA